MLGPWRRHVVVSAFLAVAIAILRLSIPYLTGVIIDDLRANNSELIGRNALLMIGAATLMALLNMSRRLTAGTISLGLEKHLRERIFDHLSTRSFGFFDRSQTGQLLSRATVDVSQVRFFLGYGLMYFFMHAATIIGVPIMLLILQPTLAIVVLVAMPPIFLLSRRYSRLAHPNFVAIQQKHAELTTVSEESILGARVVRAFGQEDRETERARKLNDEIIERELYSKRLEAKFVPLYSFIPNIALAVVVLIAANRITAGDMTLGQFFAFYGYMLQLTGPVRIVGNLLTRAQRATAAGERLFELLDDDETLPLTDHPLAAFPHESGPLAVSFKNVTFAYRNGRVVLSQLDLDVAAGETVALLGPTGSGKTTAAELIPRLYDATQGTVRIDGIDVREMDLPTLRRSVGVVGQEPFLFSASVRDNLTLGAPDATDDELWSALDTAQAAGFIRALPDGLDTLIGERGFTLSGGQRQRMAIARALAANPRILILDDATASVDARVERRITTALGNATEGRTTILIAHRPSTIALADRIVLLDAGRIVDVGTHGELLARSDRYQMVQEQKASRREFLMDPDPTEDEMGVPEELDE